VHERRDAATLGSESLATGDILPSELTSGVSTGGADAPGPGSTGGREERDPKDDRRAGLIILSAMLAGLGLASLFEPKIFTAALLFVLIIVPMVLFHEWGHYWTAKKFGIASREFFIGFGPRLWSFRRGETEFGIKAFFPLGGYVKIVGMSQYEEIEPRFRGRTFKDASRWKRAIVLAAGSATHFTTALVLIFVILGFIGVPAPTTTVDRVSDDSPAAAAGVEPGDTIVAVDGAAVSEWDDVRVALRENPGEAIPITLQRDGSEVTVNATLDSVEESGTAIGFLGVGPAERSETVGVARAVPETFGQFGTIFWGNLVAIRNTFAPSNVAKIADQVGGGESRTDYRFSSPVGVADVAQQLFSRGMLEFLWLLIIINIFVGMFNLFPVLPLDGGHLAVLGIEAAVSKVRRQPFEFDQRHLMPLTIAVLVLLMMIFASSLWLDIFDPVRL
jgi:membrane-associated protease RseP (regulator of RpoE activity)